ncbi:DPP IV N-terminal domain-containing protein [Paenarthrobacter sp. NPDC091669]|uniref:S9 family peptidase n=1 Tax=Paenarthrobacter sp. NPDC091669 TaxID=3364384 RepID=UPI0037FCA832
MSNPPTLRIDIDWSQRYQTIQDLLFDPDALVRNGSVYPIWISESVFWYTRDSADGPAIRIVDAATRADHMLPISVLAAALEKHSPELVPVMNDCIQPVAVEASSNVVTFKHDAHLWTFDPSSLLLHKGEKLSSRDGEGISVSPNGARAIVLHEHNLHLRRGASGTEMTALTADGEEANSYANSPLAGRASAAGKLQGLWSPDSRFYFTLRTDERKVPSLPIMEYLPEEGVRPQVRTNRTSLPGDEHVTEFTLILVDTETSTVTPVDFPPLSAVRMNDTIFDAQLAWWSEDSSTVFFVAIQRGETHAEVIACHPSSGTTKVLFSETSEAPIDLSVNVYGPALVKPLPASSELIWYSERTGHGHLYLYDLKSGSVKRQLTDGRWRVRELLAVDEKNREVFFIAAGVGSATGPCQGRPCKISLDPAATVEILRDDEGEHTVWRPNSFNLALFSLQSGVDRSDIAGISPGADYFVDTVSKTDGLPVTILCDRSGAKVMELEAATDVGLPATWRWPVPVSTIAADGKTEIHGLLFFPVDYDPSRSYPVVDHIYGGPQVRNCPQGAFADPMETHTFIDTAAFAQLGAFALVLDGRGTTERGRDFHKSSWKKVHEASALEDHIAAIKQLSKTYPAMDLDRVGITGFSAGGYASAHAALRFGDFFSVAVAGGGNYDQSLFWHTWGERYHGPFEDAHYKIQAAKTYADGLHGKLLFIHGLRDSGCHPAALFQLLQALNDGNKDYDLVLLPSAGHSLTGYGVRRRLDYFVNHLFGQKPPQGGFTFASKFDAVAEEIVKRGPSLAEELLDAN